MRKLLAYFLFLAMLGLTALLAQNKTPPAKVVIETKMGRVTFDHAAHSKREKDNCTVCHDQLFKQDSKAPVAFRPPHATAETKKASCGSCHHAGGTAFETKANCTNSKCHVKGAK